MFPFYVEFCRLYYTEEVFGMSSRCISPLSGIWFIKEFFVKKSVKKLSTIWGLEGRFGGKRCGEGERKLRPVLGRLLFSGKEETACFVKILSI